jgi:hypothetical protein
MLNEQQWKKFEEQCKSSTDDELEYLQTINPSGDYLKIILKEIHRRQKAKDQDISNDNKKIKKYTKIILWLTVGGIIIALISLYVSLFLSHH